MSFRFSDLSTKSFTKSMFGYDTEEVTEFLRTISYEIEKLLKERNVLKEMLREKDVSLLNYKEKDKSLQDTIEVAKEMSKKLKSDTHREAKLILNDAEQKADMIVREARDSLKEIYKEINGLKKSKIQIETNLRALLHAHLNLLDEQIANPTVQTEANNTSTTGNINDSSGENININKTSVSPVSS